MSMQSTEAAQLRSNGRSEVSTGDRRTGLRPSRYTVIVGIPEGERSLLLQGYTGAIDIASEQCVDGLQSLTNDWVGGGADIFDSEERQLLRERGYITERCEQDEAAHVKKMLSIFERKITSRLNFRVPIVLNRADESAVALNQSPEAVFDVVSQLYAGRTNGQLATMTLDIQIDEPERAQYYSSLIGEFLDQSILCETDLEVNLPAKAYPILGDHVSKNYLTRITLVVKDFDKEWIEGELMNFTAEAIRRGRWVEWVAVSDSWGAQQIRSLLGLREVLKSTLPVHDSRKAQRFVIIPVRDQASSPATPDQIRLQDVEGFRTLMRHIGSCVIKTVAVSFLPLSLPPIATLTFRPDGKIYLGFNNWPDATQVGSATADGSGYTVAVDNIEHLIAQARQKRAALLDACGAKCAFCLFCDNICNNAVMLTHPGGPLVSQNADFKQRLQRVAPLLLANGFGFTR